VVCLDAPSTHAMFGCTQYSCDVCMHTHTCGLQCKICPICSVKHRTHAANMDLSDTNNKLFRVGLR
jgi:hypothetical protein